MTVIVREDEDLAGPDIDHLATRYPGLQSTFDHVVVEHDVPGTAEQRRAITGVDLGGHAPGRCELGM